MNKKVLLIWTFLLCFVMGISAQVTIDFSTKGYANQTDVTKVNQDGVTLTFDKGSSTNPPKYYDTGSAVRLYGGGTLTVSAESNIAKIEFTFGSGEKSNANAITADCGTVSGDKYEKWEGSSKTVKFTVDGTSGHRRIQIVTVLLEGQEPEPTPSYADLQSVNALANGAKFAYSGDAVVVANPTADYLYVKDATASSLIFKASETSTLEVGQHLTANWEGQVSIYKNLFEITNTTALTATEAAKAEVKYDVVTPADITAANQNRIVVLSGVTYAAPAGDSKDMTITAADGTAINGYNQFGITISEPSASDKFDIVGAIGVYDDKVQFWPISFTRAPQVQDIDLEVCDGANLSFVFGQERDFIETDCGDKVGNINITLKPGANVTMNEPIVAHGSVTIAGDAENPATITVDGEMADALVKMGDCVGTADENGFFHIGDITFKNVNIKGMPKQLFYANKNKTMLADNLVFENSVLEVNGGNATIFDTNGGGVIGKLSIQNSTIYSKTQHTGFLYSSQSGQKATDAGLEVQTISIKNSTINNIAYSKSICNHRSNGQKWLAFEMDGNIIIDCGKDGQFVKGLNNGQSSANPQWTIKNNTFLRTVEGEIVNHNSMESTGDADEPIMANVADVPVFEDLANGVFTIDAGSLQAKKKIGDPRWLVDYDIAQAHEIDIYLFPATGTELSAALAAGFAEYAECDKVMSAELTLADNGEYTLDNTLETGCGLFITGNPEAPATINCANLAGSVITMSATPNEALKNVEGNDYYHLDNYITVSGVNLDNVRGQLLFDNNTKWCLHSVMFENCKIKLASDEATGVNGGGLISFKAGYANQFAMTNCTVWQTGASDCKYFIQYANSAKAARTGHEMDVVTFLNNTFYNVANKGQWCNYSGLAGQNTSYFTISQNIFRNCGSGEVARRILGGRNANSYEEEAAFFYYNTYAYDKAGEDGVVATVFEDNSSYDNSGTQVNDDPMFADAANADFTIGASTKQAYYYVGDPRWLVEFVEPDLTSIKNQLQNEIQKAMDLVAGTSTDDEAANALRDAINDAKNVYNTAVFEDEVQAGIDALKAAEEAYKQALATGITNVAVDEAEAECYTLQGVRIAKPATKGIFIQNGKKVIRK